MVSTDLTQTEIVSSPEPDSLESGAANDRELFEAKGTPLTRKVGFATVVALLATGTFSFLVLSNLTPFEPNYSTVLTAAAVNGFLILVLIFLIGKEVAKILRSRRKGRAASRLHVRIISLFCLVAAFPAIIVAIIAGITLDLGLDRWFEARTKNIIESSVSVARAYQNESTRVLLGNTLSMATNLDRNRRLYVLDRVAFEGLFELENRGRGFIASYLINEAGEPLLEAKIRPDQELPPVPEIALELAKKGDPVPIPPGNTNLIGSVFKLQEIPNAYLYTLITVPPAVIDALRETQQNSEEYKALEANRFPFQLAFALLYIGVCVIVLLCAIWMGISVATRIVTPIRLLMATANEVSSGNLDVAVDVRQSEGDLRFLSETFNEMLADLKNQQSDLVEAKETMDQRARFIEAVLSGVSASVIGLDQNGSITIANRLAHPLLQREPDEPDLTNRKIHELVPELGDVFDRAVASNQNQYHEQLTLVLAGRERTFSIQVTLEEESLKSHSYVLTLDDITDLVAAQRNTAWADVARRIAHEIKNPLTPIQLSAERIRRRYGKHIAEDDREVFDNCTDTIIRQVGDIGRMVDEFSSFARMPEPVMVKADLRKTLRETVFLQKVGFPKIDISLTLPDTPALVVYDERLISQALINVIKNAAEAIEALDSEEAGKIDVVLATGANETTIDVIDNGKGLPETNRQKLLEPYMTTREKGTGLGLPIVRKIFEDHGGRIDLMDAPEVELGGRGAMLRMTLPAVVQDTEAENKKGEEALAGTEES